MSGNKQLQKGTYNINSVTTAMASNVFQTNKQDPVPHIQSAERNNTTVSKRSDPRVYMIRDLCTFESA